jgi:hypothetical protein
MKKLLLMFVSLSLSACTSYDLTTPTREQLTGTWNLTTVNDQGLPFKVGGPGSREFVADVLVLADNNTFTETTTVRTTVNGVTTTETILDSGTYEFNSYAVTFHFQSNGTIGSGTLTGRKMKVTTSGTSFTYVKA